MLPVTTEAKIGVLKAAKAFLAQRGWAKGTLENDDGQLCLLGAIGYAADVMPDQNRFLVDYDYRKKQSNDMEEVRRVFNALFQQVAGEAFCWRFADLDGPLIPDFNDRSWTTLDDVYKLLDDSVKVLETQLELSTPVPQMEEPEVAEERELVLV